MIPTVYSDPRGVQQKNYEYAEYKTLDAEVIRADAVECFGAVLARCWIDKSLIVEMIEDPHYCLLQQGIVLPKSLDIDVEIHKETNRIQLQVYEIKGNQIEKICSLRLSMLASS